MITLLIGNDRHAIDQHIAQYINQIHPVWQEFNVHRYSHKKEQLDSAITTALSIPFNTEFSQVVVIDDCNFKQFSKPDFELLQNIDSMPQATELFFIAPFIDKRLRVVKYLLKKGKLLEFASFPPWRTDLIANYVSDKAKKLNLRLPRGSFNYLADAIGNDTTRIASSLLQLDCATTDSQNLTLTEVKTLVPHTTSTAIQLANAIRQGNALQVTRLLNAFNALLEIAIHPRVIVATVTTQFRTWLWIKAATDYGLTDNKEIASSCAIANPKRVYFLLKETQSLNWESLNLALASLLRLQVLLQQGTSIDYLLPALLDITKLFS